MLFKRLDGAQDHVVEVVPAVQGQRFLIALKHVCECLDARGLKSAAKNKLVIVIFGQPGVFPLSKWRCLAYIGRKFKCFAERVNGNAPEGQELSVDRQLWNEWRERFVKLAVIWRYD